MEVDVKNIGQRYRLGIWTVKAGNIPEFIEAWQSSADWIAQKLHDDGEAVLLQDMTTHESSFHLHSQQTWKRQKR
jgi:hypothetical protein